MRRKYGSEEETKLSVLAFHGSILCFNWPKFEMCFSTVKTRCGEAIAKWSRKPLFCPAFSLLCFDFMILGFVPMSVRYMCLFKWRIRHVSYLIYMSEMHYKPIQRGGAIMICTLKEIMYWQLRHRSLRGATNFCKQKFPSIGRIGIFIDIYHKCVWENLEKPGLWLNRISLCAKYFAPFRTPLNIS